ncbi:MAG TPA: hypothetical protein VEQ37_20765 [Actinomycetota bacterium]|nr:hypothetical protein [Actinomycetota bacterium]
MLATMALLATVFEWSLIAPYAFALKCGVWRWPVKTLSDQAASQVDYSPKTSSVRRLRRLDPPSSLSTDTPRIEPVEFTTYRVRAKLVGAVIEDDHDVHLVIRSPASRRKTMIVEFPYVQCNGANDSAKRAAMKRARASLTNACGNIGTSFVDLKGRVRVTGVGFWDEIHGQTGVAPNGIELHPVLRFRGTCSSA